MQKGAGMQTYEVAEIFRYIIYRCYKNGTPTNNMRLQMILYFSWVDYFKKTHKHLFDDDIFAWKFSPIVPDVYYEYCTYGISPIIPICEQGICVYKNIKAINGTIDKYYKLSTFELVNEVRTKCEAYLKVLKEKGSGKIVLFDLIKRLECEV